MSNRCKAAYTLHEGHPFLSVWDSLLLNDVSEWNSRAGSFTTSTTCCITMLSHFCSCCICCDYDPFFVLFFSFQLESGEEVEVEEFYVKFKGLWVVARLFLFSALFLSHLPRSPFSFYLKTYFSEHRDIFQYVIQILTSITQLVQLHPITMISTWNAFHSLDTCVISVSCCVEHKNAFYKNNLKLLVL